MRIDAFAHALPEPLRRAVFDRLDSPPPSLNNWQTLRTLYDLDLRLRLMDEHAVDLQIVTTPSPPIETLFGDQEVMEVLRYANDGMAEMVAKAPDRLRGVATVPLVDVDRAIEEARRAITELGLIGVLVYANPSARPLDSPDLETFYSTIEDLGVPLWLHPERSRARADYAEEEASRHGIHMMLGWPYETSVAMARIAFSGVLRRHPGLRVIAHHAGAMIPFFSNRIAMHYKPSADAGVSRGSILDEFRRFYVDTVTWGSVSALMCAYDLFGADHMMFGTDAPFGPGMGRSFVRSTVEAIEQMPISDEERAKLWHGNIVEMCGLSVT